jgi:hypothetical protein
MFPAFGINIGLTELIEENPIVKDPRRLGQIMTALESLTGILTKEQQTELVAIQTTIQKKIDKALLDQNYPLLVEGTTEMLKILEDAEKIKGGNIKLTNSAQDEFINNKGTITSKYVSLMMGMIIRRIKQLMLEDYKRAEQKNKALIDKIFQVWGLTATKTDLYTDFCKNIVFSDRHQPLKTKEESCKFREWVIKTHPEFRFQLPTVKNKITDMKLSPCTIWETMKFNPDFYLLECGFKNAWLQYYKDYRKIVPVIQTNTGNKKVPPTRYVAPG